jgi:hypothetical protein
MPGPRPAGVDAEPLVLYSVDMTSAGDRPWIAVLPIDPVGYRVVRVLAVDELGVHVRLFAQVFDRRPEAVAIDALDLGDRVEPDRFFVDPTYRPRIGISHIPLLWEAWVASGTARIGPAPLSPGEVSPDEALAAWREAEGGYFR